MEKCPHCGHEPEEGKTIYVYKCGHCGQVCRHMGDGTDCLIQDCTAPGRNGHHYNFEKVTTITGKKKK
jgi:hypothetical protein